MMLRRLRYGWFTVIATTLATLCAAPSPAQSSKCAPQGTPGAWQAGNQPVQSPLLSADGRVTLRLCAPEASTVRVFGDWDAGVSMGAALKMDGQGVWSVSFGPLKPDLYTYWFVVDGVKAIDPGNVHSASDAARIASYFIVAKPGTDSVLYQNSEVPHGEMSTLWYSSKSVASPRRALVYTPPGYRGGSEHYPVLYLLHGWGGDENEWTDLGRLTQIMDTMLSEKKIVPMIVIMPNGHHDRHAIPDISPPLSLAELAPLPPKGYDITPSVTEIAKSVVDDLVPYVDAHFRTIPDSSSRAIAGLSMGGGQAAYIGLNHPDLFAWVASFSGAIISWPGAMISAQAQLPRATAGPVIPQYKLNPEAISKNVPGLNESINTKLQLLYISCGLDDGLITSNRDFEQWLTEHKVNFVQREVPGYAHVWSFWRRSLVDLAPMLFRGPQEAPESSGHRS